MPNNIIKQLKQAHGHSNTAEHNRKKHLHTAVIECRKQKQRSSKTHHGVPARKARAAKRANEIAA